jgi:hypothetical protein
LQIWKELFAGGCLNRSLLRSVVFLEGEGERELCRMRGGNQLSPLLRTFGRLCLNVSPCSTSQEILAAATLQAEESFRREVHKTPVPESEREKKSRSGFGASESKIRAAYFPQLLNSGSCLEFVRGSVARMSTLTKSRSAIPSDAKGVSFDPFLEIYLQWCKYKLPHFSQF